MTSAAAVVASGHAVLDAVLPGGGWPVGALIDLMPEFADTPWSALLTPALAQQVARTRGLVAWIAPPWEPGLSALASEGMPPARMLWLHANQQTEQLWLTEQAIGCAEVAVVLAWLPGARAADLRRLHWAAARRGDVLFFAFRKPAGAAACSPLSLALSLVSGSSMTQGGRNVQRLRLDILRRRGPQVLAPICLPAWNPLMEAVLHDGAVTKTGPRQAVVVPWSGALPAKTYPQRTEHALDRLVLAG